MPTFKEPIEIADQDSEPEIVFFDHDGNETISLRGVQQNSGRIQLPGSSDDRQILLDSNGLSLHDQHNKVSLRVGYVSGGVGVILYDETDQSPRVEVSIDGKLGDYPSEPEVTIRSKDKSQITLSYDENGTPSLSTFDAVSRSQTNHLP